MAKIAATVRADATTPEVEEFDARIKVMSGYLSQYVDAPGDFPSVVPSNRLDLRDLKTHLAERRAQRIAR